METIVCAGSAFSFWRVPPFVRALYAAFSGTSAQAASAGAGGSTASARAQLTDEQLRVAHAEYAKTLELWSLCTSPMGRPVTAKGSYEVLWSTHCFEPGIDAPVDVLVFSPGDRRPSKAVTPHLWSGELPPRSLVRLSDGFAVTSPSFTLLLLARRLALPQLVMAVSELAGTFSSYACPASLAQPVEYLRAQGCLPDLGAWEPAFDREGRLLDLWSRPPLVRLDELAAFAESLGAVRGAARLLTAARLAVPGAASPFEAATGMLLGLPSRLGGCGLAGFSHNRCVPLGAQARGLARRTCCYADLFWEADGARRPLDLECKSARHHDNETSYLSDADRAAALLLEGVDVLEVTYAQLADERRFEAVAQLVADKLGRRLPGRSDKFLARRRDLRRAVLSDWTRPY